MASTTEGALVPRALGAAVEAAEHELEGEDFGRLLVYGRSEGSKVPVVLVHSVNAAPSVMEMRPIFEGLAPERPRYAFDLPGFGRSDRTKRLYTPRLMTDALLAVLEDVRARHGGGPVDVCALSLSCEFAARAAYEMPEAIRSLALISPTGVDRRAPYDGPLGATRGKPVLRRVFSCNVWDDGLYGALTKPGVVRYFLRRTYGGRGVDPDLWSYAVRTTKEPGAKHAPLSFLSGYLFSRDITRIYDALELPVWVSHGVRGDFVDYRGLDRFLGRESWERIEYPTGALPHYELKERFLADYEAFLERV
ncbi:MAG: alpha/beta fold hydrolase [Myxococcota bacterium]